jgi:hypothetical protein
MRRGCLLAMGLRQQTNTAYLNRLANPSNGSLLLYALNNPGVHTSGSNESYWTTLSRGRGKLDEIGFQHDTK